MNTEPNHRLAASNQNAPPAVSLENRSIVEELKANSSAPSIVSRLEITSIALALASGLLFVHGMAFHRAYLASFGLSAESFPLSADQALMRGLEGYLLMVTRGGVLFVSLSPLVVIGGSAVIFLAANLADWLWTRLTAFLAARLPKGKWAKMFFYVPGEPRAAQPLGDTVFAIFKYLFFGVVAFFVFMITTAIPAASGRYKAELIRNACSVAPPTTAESAWGTSATTVLVQYEQPGASVLAQVNGCIIATTPNFIAVYEKSGTVLIPNARVVAIKTQMK